MGTFFKGGWSKVEYDNDPAFGTPTEIPNIVKDGTGIEIETPTEDLASGQQAAAGKQATVTIVSKDLTVGTYTELIAAEAALTPVHFKFTGLNTAQKVVVKNVIPKVEYEFKPSGAINARKVGGVGYAVDEANLLTVTLS